MSRKLISAVLFLCLFAIALWFTLGAPLTRWKAEQINARVTAENALYAMHARRDNLATEITNVEQHDLTGLFWSAAQQGEATALIQSDISATASRHGILLRSVTPFKPREETLPGATGFRLEFEAHLDQLAGFLKEIEYDAPALVVSNTILRRLNRPGAPTEQPAVFVQIDVLAPVRLTGEEEG